jgi:hypothetical protein
MSVQTQIDRISGAVSAALTALSEKGVTVPAGTKVDGLAALIAAIEAGGGNIDFTPFSNVVWGTITPATDTTSVSYASFGLPESYTPPMFACFMYLSGPMSNGKHQASAYVSGYNSGSFILTGYDKYQTGSVSNTKKSIVFDSTYPLCAGVTYGYIIEKAS